MTVMFKEKTYGTKAQAVNDIVERLTSADWYNKAGVQEIEAEVQLQQFMDALNVKEYSVEWAAKSDLKKVIGRLTFEGCTLWEVLKELPDNLKKDIDADGQESLLEKVVDVVPEQVFHSAFEGAFSQFGDEKSVQFLTGNAMYLSVMACTAALAGKEELFQPILDIIEAGHVPIGPEGNTIYLI